MTQQKILYFLFCAPLYIFAQSNGQNYVKTEIMLNAQGDSKVTSIQYCDGLGRPNIIATDGLSPNEGTAYKLTEYSLSGTAAKTWLPAIKDNKFEWNTPETIKTLSRIANEDDEPFNITKRDVLNRQQSAYRPGKKWHSAKKDIHTMWYANKATGDTHKIAKKYEVSSDGKQLLLKGVWEEGSLGIEATSDEDGNTIMVFSDYMGKRILERRISNTYNDTYFVYDNYGQLRFVLSPMYQEEADLNKYAYEYRYDNRYRCVYKRLPGCMPVRYWYDDMDRQSFVQDGELLKKNRCRFMLYDDMGRLALSGTCSNTPQNCHQATVAHTSNNGICGTGYQCDGGTVLSSPKLEIANYYDDYTFFSDSAFLENGKASEMRRTNHCDATGLRTCSMVRATNGELLCTAFYYTAKGLVCDSRHSLLGGKMLLIRTRYSFTDKATSTVYELHHDNRVDSVVVENIYSRRNDALEATRVAYNGGAPRQVACLEYDDIGRITKKTFPGDCGSIEYRYNVHDEITAIHGRHFSEIISYDGLYNGNIASIENLYTGNAAANKYVFTYDKLNRMVKAISSGENGYMEDVCYDQNGNVTRLLRRGKHNDGSYKMTDALIYSRNGNQIQSISDNAGQLVYDGGFDFKSSGSSTAYCYDSNGSLTYDPDKGITIVYSDTGSPVKIKFDSGNSTDYVYGADGAKLKVEWTTRLSRCRGTNGFWDDEENTPAVETSGGANQNRESKESVTNSQEYIGPFIIKDGVLSQFLFNGGYCTLDGNVPVYHYYEKDHLGSIRVVVSEEGSVEQNTYYYPFGGIYGDASTNLGVQSFKFNGKELDGKHGLNLYDYGARMYDPVVASWTSVDPLCEKYYNISPYVYCGNNPVNIIDPDGKDGIAIVDYNKKTIEISQTFYYNNNSDGLIDNAIVKDRIIENFHYGHMIIPSEISLLDQMGFSSKKWNVNDGTNEWNVTFSYEFIGLNSDDEVFKALASNPAANALCYDVDLPSNGVWDSDTRTISLGSNRGGLGPERGSTLIHEIGHSWGLPHEKFISRSPIFGNKNNGTGYDGTGIMSYGNNRTIKQYEVEYGIEKILRMIPESHSSSVKLHIKTGTNTY